MLTAYDPSGAVIPCDFSLTKNSAGFFAISGNNLVTGTASILAGNYSVRVHATGTNTRFGGNAVFNITVTAAAPPPPRRHRHRRRRRRHRRRHRRHATAAAATAATATAILSFTQWGNHLRRAGREPDNVRRYVDLRRSVGWRRLVHSTEWEPKRLGCPNGNRQR